MYVPLFLGGLLMGVFALGRAWIVASREDRRMSVAILIGLLAVLLLLGVPVAFALLAAPLPRRCLWICR